MKYLEICEKASDVFNERSEWVANQMRVSSLLTDEEVNLSLSMVELMWRHSSQHLCESPIEQIMLAGLMWADFGEPMLATPVRGILNFCGIGTGILKCVTPQKKIGPYRLDFLVEVGHHVWPMREPEIFVFGVECDGHDFHEKTKDQAKRDKSRDRALLAEGLRVFHFTGSEIFNDVDACTGELEKYARKLCLEYEIPDSNNCEQD